MARKFSEDFKLDVVRAYINSTNGLSETAATYNVGRSTLSKWVRDYSEECKYTNTTTSSQTSDSAKEIKRLNLLIQEKNKEIEFLKKAAAFFAKEID